RERDRPPSHRRLAGAGRRPERRDRDRRHRGSGEGASGSGVLGAARDGGPRDGVDPGPRGLRLSAGRGRGDVRCGLPGRRSTAGRRHIARRWRGRGDSTARRLGRSGRGDRELRERPGRAADAGARRGGAAPCPTPFSEQPVLTARVLGLLPSLRRTHCAEVIDDLWYKNAVVYCLDVKTFQDSNGDGVGDFEGLARRLAYLSGIGVGAIWLLPFYPSPRRDNGYDITDYYGVDPQMGSLGDFVDFTHEARKHGIRVLVDLVVNHTSDQHPWFKAAVKDPGSPYRDWYIWSKRKPKDAEKGMVFPGVQSSTWTYHPKAKAYYFHRFYDFQPDLNTDHPQVQEEIRRIMGFWLQLGVSGFRMDAVPFVIQKKGPIANHPEQFHILQDLRSFLQWRTGDAIILGEANVLPREDRQYFGDEADRMHMMFNFQVNQSVFYALASADVRPLVKALERTRVRPETSQWAHFLRNNDELDLGRLTEEQRQTVFSEFGPDKTMQLYDRGIRRRLAPMFNGDRRRLELAYSLLFTLPGTPVLRYGDELGMGDDL